MQDLRIILIILGAVAIAALLIHGLWTSQKGRQKNIADKPIDKVVHQPEPDADGFDSDGIGPVRVISSSHQAASLVDDTKVIDDWQDTPHFSAVSDDEEDDDDDPRLDLPPRLSKSTFSGTTEPASSIAAADSSADSERDTANAAWEPPATNNVSETQAEQRARRYQEGEIDPLFDEPTQAVTEPERPAPQAQAPDAVLPEPTEPQSAEPAPPLTKNAPDEPALADAKPATDSLGSDALEEQASLKSEPTPDPKPVKPLRKVPKTWQDVYVINLVARPNKQLQGHDLIRALTQADFSFGDMDIFHRHQNAQAQGEPLFSVINMVKPGTFNPNAMAEFSTPGVSVFMQLPDPGMAKNQFNLMVQAAENMAETLDGILLDGQRRPLSPDYLAQCREQLRDFDSQAQ